MSEKIDINKVHDDFNKRVKELQESIDTTDPNESKSNINDLKKEIEQVSHLLPTYQQLSYSEQIRTLFDQVEKKKRPTRRFKFSKRPERSKPTSQPIPKPQEVSKNEETPTLQNLTSKIHKITESSKHLIQSIQNSILIIPQTESITLRNISNSIIYINSIGPAFLQNITDSCIFVHAHQLRIHDTQDTVILTQDIGNGIIERSSGLVFKSFDEGDGIVVSDFDHPGKGDESPSFERKVVSQCDLELKSKLENDELEALKGVLDEMGTRIKNARG